MPKTPNLTCRAPMTPGLEFVPELPEGQPEPKDEAKRKESNALWVASNDQRKGKRTWHKVVKAGWQIPLSNWSTACGWNFTKNPHKVSMSVSLLFNQTRCRKCNELMKIRDKVKEGQMLWLTSYRTSRHPTLTNECQCRDALMSFDTMQEKRTCIKEGGKGSFITMNACLRTANCCDKHRVTSLNWVGGRALNTSVWPKL